MRLSDAAITLDELLVGDLLLETLGDAQAFLTAPVDFCGVRLATLSACESGTIDAVRDAADESMGLSTAFVVYGAESVVASLWIVDDFSTAY